MSDPMLVEMAEPTSISSNIIYMNGCFDGGCTISPGFESSIDDSSSIIPQTSTIQPFDGGEAAWNALVECMRGVYAPFDVEVVEEDPGSEPHFEAIVAGSPQEAGFSAGVGGVAPFNCGVINNAITFSFANVYNGNVAAMCWTAAQETAHAFGLDHEFLCEDPMTYLTSCGADKVFQDRAVECGEFSPRECMCGTQTQNSFQMILGYFGPTTPSPPEVRITTPKDGDEVEAGFWVRADATDDIEVSRGELWVNGRMISSVTEPPWHFEAPRDVGEGRLMVEVRAADNFGAVGSDRIDVILGEPCLGAEDCESGEACVDGRCVAGPGTPGGLGEPCQVNGDCVSQLCAEAAEEDGRFCVEPCRLGEGGCPEGFGCRDSGDFGVCWPGFDDSGGCGCRAGKGGAGALLGLAVLFGLLVLRRRRAP